MNFCSECGSAVSHAVPEGDDRLRNICQSCGTIHYENPKLVVGCLPEWEGKILMVKRSIDPFYGKWTLPAGFLENGESALEGAKRETLEEAGVHMLHLVPYTLYNLTQINQIYLMFQGKLTSGKTAPGKESLEARFFTEAEIPWDQIAFKAIGATLKHYFEDRPHNVFPFHMGDIFF